MGRPKASNSLRREKGSGSISQDKFGYCARILIGSNPEGKRVYKKHRTKTKAEAQNWLVEQNIKQKQQTAISGSNMLISDYMTLWLNNVKKQELKPKSFTTVWQTLQYQVFPAIGNIRLSDLTTDHIQKMINDLYEEGASYSTVKKTINACNNCMKTAVQKRDILWNPCEAVVIPSKENFTTRDGKIDEDEDVKIYTDEEKEKIINAARAEWGNGKRRYRLGDAIPLLFYTGMRMGELLGLQWKNVDFEKRVIKIRMNRECVKDTDRESGYKMVSQSPKTKNSRRDIPMSSMAEQALRELQKETGNYEYVLSSTSGEPIWTGTLCKLHKAVLTFSGVDKDRIWGLHALRHTFASSLFDKKVDIKVISSILGHSSVKVTYDIYVHLLPGAMTDAINAVELLE